MSKKKNGRNRRAPKRAGGRAANGMKVALRHLPLPRTFAVSFTDQLGFQFSGTGGVADIRSYGILEPLSRTPSYMLNFFDMYRYMKVIGISLEITYCNITSGPASVFTSTLPFADVATTTYAQIVEQPSSQLAVISSAGGLDKITFKRRISSLEYIGADPGPKYWITAAQAASGSPIDNNEPALVLGVAPSGTGVYTVFAQGKLTYHVEYFDLKSVG